ncbi:hypothetical protein BU16DRAFT_531883 [Lophium mytilinum]|uniref:GDP/GTP exchange factor Sec2 N-terminal domain-containing protein n=1 Tax=Lophium mytilinum TaxID=390894 RepID=A0A6A6Q8X6_9PEZI|nr:hypothetical protein BU16DRAFT_531883 [Lophium mytilinum]
MAEYFSGHWGVSNGLTSSSRQAQLRSLSPVPKQNGPNKLTKSTSTPNIARMAATVASPSPLTSVFHPESEVLNTIPDPRTPSPIIAVSRSGSTDSRASQHPDLSNEVAALSTKLINSINTQTRLDDSLQECRHELENARQRLKVLEASDKDHNEAIEKGLLVSRGDYDKMEARLRKEAADERQMKAAVDKEKRRIESELEQLTTALFTEANEMVADARKKTEDAEKRNESLKQQISDTEVLLRSHQEQLQDLKAVMQQMSSEGETETNTHISTAPSTPGLAPQDKMNRIFEAANLTPNTPGSDDIPPDHPLRFSHLIHPVLRSDTVSYREFQEMLRTARASAPSSRAASGNYGGLNVMGLGSLTQNGSTTSLPSANNSPSLGSTGSPRDSLISTPLKDAKFYKRAVAEDIEPTLRLDVAPGISWLARRTVLTSMTVGSLVVEPHPPIPKFRGPVFPCSLCGENRKGDEYVRKFRFRTSEADDAQRYPLCDYCLTRVRTSCDYIGFLRMVQNGHWRAETEEEKKAAWEESVRLRERMFWSRLGGGVVPSFIPLRDSPRSPHFAHGRGIAGRKSDSSEMVRELGADETVDVRDVTGGGLKPSPKELDPFTGVEKGKRVSIGKTVLEATEDKKLDTEEEKRIEKEAEAQLHNEVRRSLQRMELGEVQSQETTHDEKSTPPVEVIEPTPPVETIEPPLPMETIEPKLPVETTDPEPKTTQTVATSTSLSRSTSPSKKGDRLSITIPGAFE